jgi:hypothetical protein
LCSPRWGRFGLLKKGYEEDYFTLSASLIPKFSTVFESRVAYDRDLVHNPKPTSPQKFKHSVDQVMFRLINALLRQKRRHELPLILASNFSASNYLSNHLFNFSVW